MQYKRRGIFLIVVTLLIRLALPARAQTGPRRDSGDPGLPPGGAPSVAPTTLVPGSEIKDAAPAVEAPEKEPPPAGPATPPPAVSAAKAAASAPDLDLKPAAMDIGGLPLAKLITSDNTFSGLGTFSQLLPKYGISTYIHGIAIGYVVG